MSNALLFDNKCPPWCPGGCARCGSVEFAVRVGCVLALSVAVNIGCAASGHQEVAAARCERGTLRAGGGQERHCRANLGCGECLASPPQR
eukprot:173731-Chlamydomonas_euryale.AAC.6